MNVGPPDIFFTAGDSRSQVAAYVSRKKLVMSMQLQPKGLLACLLVASHFGSQGWCAWTGEHAVPRRDILHRNVRD